MPNYLDTDSDGDGIRDSVEGPEDADGDGSPNYLDTDSDDDGVEDKDESLWDSDGDGTPNFLDRDATPDERGRDDDHDGIPNSLEGAAANRDTDGDGTPDYRDLDSDNDGLQDTEEACGVRGGLSWLSKFRHRRCDKPLLDTDKDGKPDYLDTDSDNDGLPDRVESTADVVKRAVADSKLFQFCLTPLADPHGHWCDPPGMRACVRTVDQLMCCRTSVLIVCAHANACMQLTLRGAHVHVPNYCAGAHAHSAYTPSAARPH